LYNIRISQGEGQFYTDQDALPHKQHQLLHTYTCHNGPEYCTETRTLKHWQCHADSKADLEYCKDFSSPRLS